MNVSVLSLFCSLPSQPTLNLGCWPTGKSDTVCPFIIYQLHVRCHSTGVRGRNYFASGKGKIRKKAGALSCEQDTGSQHQLRGQWNSTGMGQQVFLSTVMSLVPAKIVCIALMEIVLYLLQKSFLNAHCSHDQMLYGTQNGAGGVSNPSESSVSQTHHTQNYKPRKQRWP